MAKLIRLLDFVMSMCRRRVQHILYGGYWMCSASVWWESRSICFYLEEMKSRSAHFQTDTWPLTSTIRVQHLLFCCYRVSQSARRWHTESLASRRFHFHLSCLELSNIIWRVLTWALLTVRAISNTLHKYHLNRLTCVICFGRTSISCVCVCAREREGECENCECWLEPLLILQMTWALALHAKDPFFPRPASRDIGFSPFTFRGKVKRRLWGGAGREP